ncbi:unnamed protein product, partial [Heligmosomoides polygyrus]|uniref:TNFR-Cys domain-containing protein n=1 Tax=Heligmosomoides polygyrus TaxID=6339 RepID=A0A183F2C8_HELPZ
MGGETWTLQYTITTVWLLLVVDGFIFTSFSTSESSTTVKGVNFTDNRGISLYFRDKIPVRRTADRCTCPVEPYCPSKVLQLDTLMKRAGSYCSPGRSANIENVFHSNASNGSSLTANETHIAVAELPEANRRLDNFKDEFNKNAHEGTLDFKGFLRFVNPRGGRSAQKRVPHEKTHSHEHVKDKETSSSSSSSDSEPEHHAHHEHHHKS